MHEVWKIGPPARVKVSCQEYQVQVLPENWTFSQSVQNQEKNHPASQPCSEPPGCYDTNIDEKGVRQPNPPPRVNMFKVVNHTETNRGKFSEEKQLKFPIASHARGPYNYHIVVRVDTGADINCMNENTFK